METSNLKLLTLEECIEFCNEYDPKINYIEVLESILCYQNKQEAQTKENNIA